LKPLFPPIPRSTTAAKYTVLANLWAVVEPSYKLFSTDEVPIHDARGSPTRLCRKVAGCRGCNNLTWIRCWPCCDVLDSGGRDACEAAIASSWVVTVVIIIRRRRNLSCGVNFTNVIPYRRITPAGLSTRCQTTTFQATDGHSDLACSARAGKDSAPSNSSSCNDHLYRTRHPAWQPHA
jgi:hypothetical protein